MAVTVAASASPEAAGVVSTSAGPAGAGVDRGPAPNAAGRRAPAAWLRRPGLVMALLFVLFVTASAVFPDRFTSYDPDATAPAEKLLAPSGGHWFGTDELGRDLFSRVLHGSSLTIEATFGAVVIAMITGLAVGVLAGFFGGWFDALLMRGVDVMLAIPRLLLALTIVTALGFGMLPIAIAVGVGILPGFARITRAQVLTVKSLPYIEAARTGGASWTRVLLRHILPNSAAPVLVLAVLDLGVAILAISALSFLGFGAPPPAAEWGTLISEGRNYLITSPWLTLLPGLFVGLVVFSLNHISRSIEELQR